MWNCKECQERVEESFEVCWNCGTSREGVGDPAFVSETQRDKSRNFNPGKDLSKCLKCGAQKVIPSLRIIDQDGEHGSDHLAVRLDRNPEAWIFKGAIAVELRASICGGCGFTELYAANPSALWSAWEERSQQ